MHTKKTITSILPSMGFEITSLYHSKSIMTYDVYHLIIYILPFMQIFVFSLKKKTFLFAATLLGAKDSGRSGT
jgi:hypothetical protein